MPQGNSLQIFNEFSSYINEKIFVKKLGSLFLDTRYKERYYGIRKQSSLKLGSVTKYRPFKLGGGFRGPPGPPPLFLLVELFRALYLPLCQYVSSNVDLKCLLCVCVSLLKYNLTIIELVSSPSYSPPSRSLSSLVCLGPLFKNSGSAPGT